MTKYLSLTFLFLAFGLMNGCIPDPVSAEEQLATDLKKIESYLSDNNLVAESTASGLHYIIEVEGTGGHPNQDSEVTVNYKGYLLNGNVFEETGASPATFVLGGLITGWREGIPLLQKGGKGQFFLPSELGYGRSGSGSIPANTVLIFEIELVDF